MTVTLIALRKTTIRVTLPLLIDPAAATICSPAAALITDQFVEPLHAQPALPVVKDVVPRAAVKNKGIRAACVLRRRRYQSGAVPATFLRSPVPVDLAHRETSTSFTGRN
jgi:hypothetical protein